MHLYAAFGKPFNSARIQAVLRRQYALAQRFRRIAWYDGYALLRDNGTAIHVISNEMHGRPVFFRARRQRALMVFRPGKEGSNEGCMFNKRPA